MTQSATQPQPIPLDPITLGALRCTTIDALPHHPQAGAEEIARQHDAAYLVVAALRPRDPLEALLAARIVAAHYHIMDNFRCAAQRDLPPNLQLRFQGHAVALSRTMDTTLHHLLDRQTAPPRRVDVWLPAQAPAPAAQPVPKAARTEPPPQAQAAAPQQAAPIAPQAAPPAAPAPAQTAAPATPVSAPSQPNAGGTIPAGSSPATLEPATLEQLMAEVAARAATSVTALAA